MTRLKNIRFFPNDLKFWVYHGGMSAILILAHIALSLIIGEGSDLFALNLAAFVLWTSSYSLSVLAFRFFYLKKRWHELPIGKLIFVSLVFAFTASNLAFGFFAVTFFPIFGDEMYAYQLLETPKLTESKYLFTLYFSNVFATTIFIMAWVFLYIGITTARTAKKSKIDNLRLQNSLKEAQLSSLSNQLNPHFLFNSLNNIRFMIHENAQQADNMITALSEVLRYSLESSEHEKRLLSKEVDVILRYIEIVNIQFEERLNFSMDIPDNLMQLQVPPMLLQMLIENAVKHGLEQIQHGADISLVATTTPEHVEFTVLNDIPETSHYQSDSTGLGLKNIQQRLQLLYGKHASIEAKKINGKFKVIIRLPL